MKRILLLVFLSFLAVQGFSQTFIGLYGGGGCATSNNYDIAPSGGLELMFARNSEMFIGADLFYQGYSLYADNEANSSRHGTGNAGIIERFAGSYVFLAPKFSYGVGKRKNLKFFFDAGVGYNINGFDSLRKFDRGYYTNGYYTTYASGIGQYDSSLDKTSNINKLMFRLGVGATEFFCVSSKRVGNDQRTSRWFLTLTEDFGFLTNSLTTTGTTTDGSRTQFSFNGLRPGYVSLQIGISHCSNCTR